jgi:hypothetical protein
MTDKQRDEALPERREDVDLERRKSLTRFGGLAASVAPAMIVLVKAQEAVAHLNGRPWRDDQPGHLGGPPFVTGSRRGGSEDAFVDFCRAGDRGYRGSMARACRGRAVDLPASTGNARWSWCRMRRTTGWMPGCRRGLS